MSTSLKIILHTKKNADDTQPVMLQCIHTSPAGNTFRRRTICRVKAHQFDKKTGRIKGHPNQILYNALIAKAFHEAETRLLTWRLEGTAIDPELLIAGDTPKACIRPMLLSYGREYTAKCRLKGALHTATVYEHHLNRLAIYLGKTLDDSQKDIALAEVTEVWVLNFAAWLRANGCKSENTIHRRMGFMGTIFNDAQKRGHIKVSPMAFLEFKKQKVRKVKLTEAQLLQLEHLEIQDERTADARNTFMLQFYAYGSRISDALSWKKTDIHRRADGVYLEYTSIKTKKQLSVRLHQNAVTLVEHYESTVLGPYLLPWLADFVRLPNLTDQQNQVRLTKQLSSKTSIVNTHLGELSKQLNFGAKITTHIARHSFATIADSRIADKRKISAALGHSNFATTEVYLSELHQGQVNDAMTAVWQ